jgi:hypothetical protein
VAGVDSEKSSNNSRVEDQLQVPRLDLDGGHLHAATEELRVRRWELSPKVAMNEGSKTGEEESRLSHKKRLVLIQGSVLYRL